MHTAERYHDISCGHRVTGHESKCRHLHGHNYRIHFVCIADFGCSSLDNIGRVIDFTAIKERLCMWVESNWDHKFLAWEHDPVMQMLYNACVDNGVDVERMAEFNIFEGSIILTPFNPTAENMAQYLVDVIGPIQLEGTGVKLVTCRVEETMKCSATYSIG